MSADIYIKWTEHMSWSAYISGSIMIDLMFQHRLSKHADTDLVTVPHQTLPPSSVCAPSRGGFTLSPMMERQESSESGCGQ